MTNEQQYEVNTRGYRVPPKSDECGSGEGIIAPGQIAYLRYSQGTRGTDSWLVAGTCVRVLSFANAGFRGIEAYVQLTSLGQTQARLHCAAGNLDPVDPAIAAAIANGRIVETEDDRGTVCYAPAEGDGVLAEIFRLWVEQRDGIARPARFFVTNAANDFAVVFASDTHAAGAVEALVTANETWGTWQWPFGGRNA